MSALSNQTPQGPVSAEQYENLKIALEKTENELQQLKQKPDRAALDKKLEDLTADEALAILADNPVRFIKTIIAQEASVHLADLKEEAELQGALRAARKTKPDFEKFESFILDEMTDLIMTDEDGVIDPWPVLLDKAYDRFKTKFTEMVQKNPEILEGRSPKSLMPVMEGAASKKPFRQVPQFTRKQIADMSVDQFVANEAAINEALKNNRIV